MTKFLAGAIVGFVAGVLLAPEKGETTRDNLAFTASRWKQRLNRLAGRRGIDELRSFLNRNIDGVTEDVRTRMLTILSEAEEMAYNPSEPTISGVGSTQGSGNTNYSHGAG